MEGYGKEGRERRKGKGEREWRIREGGDGRIWEGGEGRIWEGGEGRIRKREEEGDSTQLHYPQESCSWISTYQFKDPKGWR